jgi:A/G-specific adenine glycosylase
LSESVTVLDVDEVLRWAGALARDLPWRHTRDPWAVLVSEVMAQQTQVDRVIPKWLAFLDRWPTPEALAESALADVLRAWEGLGYPRRARNLHQAAIAIVEHASFPDSLPELLKLPGVGSYTARAVLAFAFEQDVAVVDTNVARVYARQLGRRLSAREVQSIADGLVPPGEGWAWNQAMIDLGAIVCRARDARCNDCPVRPSCLWAGEGDDPAIGSAGVSGRQSRFTGSDRQGRGRLMRAIARRPVLDTDAALATAMGWPDDHDRARRVAVTLMTDGLAEVADGIWRLAE